MKVLNIVYAGGKCSGGFYPDGMNLDWGARRFISIAIGPGLPPLTATKGRRRLGAGTTAGQRIDLSWGRRRALQGLNAAHCGRDNDDDRA